MSAAYEYREVLMQATGINLAYGSNIVLRDTNLIIRNLHRPGLTQGQILSIVGRSGAGKSTLFRILAGLKAPDTGQVRVGIGGIEQPVKPGLVGVVAQSHPLLNHRTVIGNLLVAGKLAGHPNPGQRAEELLARFGILEKAASYASEISGGQRQRVAICQQVMAGQQFILMDEPFSGLDVLAKDEACRLIADVAAADELLTIIVVTHDI